MRHGWQLLDGILSRHSKGITDATFSDITGWQPQVSRAAETMTAQR